MQLSEMSCPYLEHQGDEGSPQKEMEYSDYLRLSSLLESQHLESEKNGKKCHDEHLFIVIHQAFELWFKQIIYEFNSIVELMLSHLDERKTLLVLERLERVRLIMNLILDKFPILETMTPQSFLDFRGFLFPASGFQSVQFRVLENKFGLKQENRSQYQQKSYRETFKREGALQAIDNSVNCVSLFTAISRWLERTPGLDELWKNYKAAADDFIDRTYKKPYEEETNPDEKADKEKSWKKQLELFVSVDNAEDYEVFTRRGDRKFSQRAFQAALMITTYSYEPRFQLPSRILSLLMDIDGQLMDWRQKHALLVHRMIGTKVGTASSSGYYYLRTTLGDKYKVFVDLFNMATFLLPSEVVPALSETMTKRLGFVEVSMP